MAQDLVKMFDQSHAEYDPNDQCSDLYQFTQFMHNCKDEEELEDLVNEYFYGWWHLKYSNEDNVASIFEQVVDKRGEDTIYDDSGYILEVIWR